jgi:hypothetical protein
MLAFADAFRAIMLAFLVATLLVPLIRKVVPPKPAARRRRANVHVWEWLKEVVVPCLRIFCGYSGDALVGRHFLRDKRSSERHAGIYPPIE